MTEGSVILDATARGEDRNAFHLTFDDSDLDFPARVTVASAGTFDRFWEADGDEMLLSLSGFAGVYGAWERRWEGRPRQRRDDPAAGGAIVVFP